ncbi:MAG: carbohydrate porin [Pirellulaceae bacterium]
MTSPKPPYHPLQPVTCTSPRTPWRILWLALAIAIMLVNFAEAKRFKRYPGDEEKKQQVAPRESSQKRDLSGGPEQPAEPGDGVETEEVAEPADEDFDAGFEDQPEGGLFGTFLHGRGPWGVEYIYTGETSTNMRGGIRTRDATRYLGLFDLAVTGELDETGFPPGGTVFLLAENSHGRGLTEQYVGDQQVLSNIDGGTPFTQVTEYWWQRSLLEEFITVRLGKQDANAEFAVVELGGDFVNSSYGMHHNIPMPAWPHPSMGVVTQFRIAEPLVLKAGVFDGAALGGSWGFSGTGETFSIGECEATWSFDDGSFPGDCHVGMWYHSGEWESLADADRAYSGNHGVYLGLDQLIVQESEENDGQGLGVFAQYAWASEDRNDVPNFAGAGLVYKGLLPNRDDDITGLGMARAIFSPDLEDRTPETAIELFHKIQWSDFIVVQPDLQFIASPGGTERDAFVFSLRYEVVL